MSLRFDVVEKHPVSHGCRCPPDARLGSNGGPGWASAESGRCSCWSTAACGCRGRPKSRCGVTGQPGVDHTVLMLFCRASFLVCCYSFPMDELFSDELSLVG